MRQSTVRHILGLLVLVVPLDMVALADEQPTVPPEDAFAAEVEASAAAAESWVPIAGLTFEMKAAADSFLVRQMGNESYMQTVVFDPIRTDSSAVFNRERGREYRYVSYWLVVPNDTDVVSPMYVGVNPDGCIRSPSGVPPCASSPSECVFLDREAAFAVASAAGLAPGLIPWRWRFLQDAAHGYFYEISTVLERERSSDVVEYIRLDANDGEVFYRAVAKEEHRIPIGRIHRDTPN